MWISRIKYELLQEELENAKKERRDTDERYRALQWENFDLKDTIKDLTSEIQQLKRENEAFLKTLLFGDKEAEKDDRDT